MMKEQCTKTLQDAVKYVLSHMTAKEKDMIKNSAKKELINFHLGLGTYIRDKFRLWDDNEELLISCGKLEPDEASMVIIRELWESLQNEKNIENA